MNMVKICTEFRSFAAKAVNALREVVRIKLEGELGPKV